MIYYLILFVIFLVVAQFAMFLLPFLFPLFLIFFVISLFRKPKIHVYTNTYTFPDSAWPGSAGTSTWEDTPQLITRTPLENSIDAEFTEHSDTEETGE